ncbi:MAG: hypothetical protein AB7W59_30185, partial [Acidimicrobiia bacterium]
VVLDLAARRLAAIEEIGDGRQLVRWFPARAATAALTPPEASVAELVRSRLGTGATVPVGELSLGDDEAAARWWKRFEADVVGEGRSLGLLRRRWPTGVRLLLAAGLLVPAGFSALALESGDALQRLAGETGEGTDLGGGTAIALVAWVLVLVVADRRLRAWVTTAAGAAATSRWLGARAFLAGQPGLAEAPPAAVVVRGRHLAAAVALGVAPVASQRLPIGPQRDDVAWVQRGGLWREVTISYPRARRSGGLAVTLVGAALRLGGCLFGLWCYVWFLSNIGRAILDSLGGDSGLPVAVPLIGGALIVGLPTAGALFGLVVAVRAGSELVWGLTDVGGHHELVGPVLRAPTTRDDDGRRVPSGFLAVDDGRSDELVALYCPRLDARPGQRVRIVSTPRLRIVRRAEILG